VLLPAGITETEMLKFEEFLRKRCLRLRLDVDIEERRNCIGKECQNWSGNEMHFNAKADVWMYM
jgi:hypothetical protein